MPTNDIVPFCATDTGTNLLSQAAYLADSQRPIGNQPGIARSQLVNKALRQSTYIAACLAQFISNVTGDNVIDDENTANVLATMAKAFRKAPTITKFLSGSGTYTVPANVAWLRVRMVGGGGPGTGGAGAAGSAGGNTTFGAGLLVANGGSTATGGSASLGAAVGLALAGGDGALAQVAGGGGNGASTPFGSGGGGGTSGTPFPTVPVANTGVGGGGGNASAAGVTGVGGGAGGYVDAIISSPAATYAYAVGTGGLVAFTATGGANGASGIIIIEEHY